MVRFFLTGEMRWSGERAVKLSSRPLELETYDSFRHAPRIAFSAHGLCKKAEIRASRWLCHVGLWFTGVWPAVSA